MTFSQIMRRRRGAIWRPRSIHYWSHGSRLANPDGQEMCAKWGAAKAKRMMGRRILEGRPAGAAPRPDSVRKAVERRMAKLGITTGQKRRKPDTRKPKPWTASQTTALLGALGGDATI